MKGKIFRLNTKRPILECRNLSISYFTRKGEIPAVVDFNLKLWPGEAHGIVGESGCGKSTVALAIMQHLGRSGSIVSGEIYFEGQDLTRLSKKELRQIRGSQISMIYQEPMASLNPSMRISKQLMEIPIYHDKVNKKIAWIRAEEMLKDMQLPDTKRIMAAYPHQISGGQQQRVIIAMALLSNPKLLLLDEPTTALDVTVEAGITDLVKHISKRFGTSMIYISHNLGLILETCNRISVMYSGEVVEVGDITDVFDEMRHPYTQGLFNSIPLPAADKNSRPLRSISGQLPLPHERPVGCYFGPRCHLFKKGQCDYLNCSLMKINSDKSHYTRCVRAKEIDWSLKNAVSDRRSSLGIGSTILKVDKLKKYYKVGKKFQLEDGRKRRARIKANQKINFNAKEAELIAIVGESGCGKSTLARVLMGLESATDGDIHFRGCEISKLPVDQRSSDIITNLQMIFQNPFDSLNPSYRIGTQIASVLKRFGVEKERKKIKQRVNNLFDMVKLPREYADLRPRQLSGGQKQRVGIARAFAGQPDLVIADEPLSALDVSVQAAITELLMDIQNKKRTTLLFISHDLSIVKYLADSVLVMYLGQVMERGSNEQIFSPPYHPYTEALLSAVPIADVRVEKKKILLKGELPSPTNPPQGCPFCTRCHRMIKGICEKEKPSIKELSPGHTIACHLDETIFQTMEPIIKAAKSRDIVC